MKIKTLIACLLLSIFVFTCGCSTTKPTNSRSPVTSSSASETPTTSNGSSEKDSSISSGTTSAEQPSSPASSESTEPESSATSSTVSSSNSTEPSEPQETFYTVTFTADDGTGTAPTVADKKNNESFNLPQNTFTKLYYTFVGWGYNGNIYSENQSFTMPNSNVEFQAIWKSDYPGTPEFSQESYFYDRLGGGAIELPYDLDGAKLYYVYVDGVALAKGTYEYNDSTKCIEINEYTAIRLADGTHTIKTVTDAGDAIPATCTLITDNSVKTAYNSGDYVNFKYGKDDDVKLNFNLNGTTVKSMMQGDRVIPSSYYSLNGNTVSFSADWAKRYYGDTKYEIILSNNDVYSFTVRTNVIFYTDYDVTTIHDTTNSNTGQNSLYQYYSAVSIVDAPTSYGFESGKCLRIKPNTTDVAFDCNGYFTLKSPSCSFAWYNAGFDSAKDYRVSFDYATENTTTGELFYRNEAGSWGMNLFIGTDNDNQVHHFETVIDGSIIGNGLFLRAFFKGGSAGYVYIDNFSVSETEITNDISLTTKTVNVTNGSQSFTVNGNFGNYSVISFKRQGTNYWDNTYDSDSDIDNYQTIAGNLNLKHITEMTSTKIVFGKTLIDQLYGTETILVSFSNGQTESFTVTSNQMFYTDYDETYINEESSGNIRSCQDTSVRSFVTYNGGKALKYTPGNATLGHATNWGNGAANDNKIMTFSNETVNHYWWEFAMGTTGKLYIKFDYKTEGTNFVFQWWKADGTRTDIPLTDNGTGSFYQEINLSELSNFAIGYSGTAKPDSSVYMIIDNYGFGKC